MSRFLFKYFSNVFRFKALVLFSIMLLSCSSTGKEKLGLLSYADPEAVYTMNGTIIDNAPTYTGFVSSWNISPELPKDLFFNQVNGVISGTPRQLRARTAYTVTAGNYENTVSVTIAITVNDHAPENLQYSEQTVVYSKDKPIVNNLPSVTGSGLTYSITPELPSGLSLDPISGIIFGTPTVVQSVMSYIITAANSSGSVDTTISITVTESEPSNLRYTTLSAVYTVGGAIIDNLATVTGSVDSFAIAPALPAGLTINSTTGTISGTPMVTLTATIFTITAANSNGNTARTISIAVNNSAPSSLRYATTTAFYTLNSPITNNVPTVNGSGITFSIAPPLPAGLAMDPVMGIISGTPTEIQAVTIHTVTAINSGGSATAIISIGVNMDPPSNLLYSVPDAVYTLGGTIQNNVPTVSGSGVTYTIFPSLPLGLNIDAGTGVISGSPSALQSITSYLISAANSGGSVSTIITITVNSDSPLNLAYAYPSSLYTKGLAINNNTATVTGSGLTFSILPALPAGLSFDLSTGTISGTPAVTGSTDYTITAQNASGTIDTTLSITVISDANLSGLYVSQGILYPDFAPGILEYTLRLSLTTTTIDVTPNASDASGAIIRVNGTVDLSGQPSEPRPMNLGDNTITIEVTGDDTVTIKTYSVRAVRGFLQEAFVKSSNSDPYDNFGYGVAIDGDTVVVGAPFESSGQQSVSNGVASSSDNSLSSSGAAYVYRRSGTSWYPEAYLKASNADNGDEFGYSVAISGDTIVVGAIREDSGQSTVTNGAAASSDNSKSSSGAAYVFKRTGNTWAAEAYLKAPNPDANDNFGYSVSVSGDTIVVGAPYEDSNQTYLSNGTGANSDNSLSGAGAAYVYKRTGSAWAQEAYLKAGSPDVGDYYGLSVGVSGDTVVVGALNEDGNQNFITNGTSDTSTNGLGNSGAAYVYIRTGTVWEQQAYIKASNVDFYDYFGFSVSISGDTIVAGADYESGNYNYIWNGPIAGTNDSLSYSGAVYVFKRDGTIWHQEAYLKPPNPDSNDRLGYHVSISGDIIAATAIYESSSQQFNSYGSNASADNSQDKSGAVYVFKRNGVNWSQNAYLKAPNGASMDYFGYNCAVSGDTIVIGAHPESSGQRGIVNNISAPMDNSSLESGAVYIIRE